MARDAEGEKYESTRSTRFYPGAKLSEERKQRILDFDIDLDEVTVEDILFNTARAYTGTFYAVVGLIEKRWGKEAAHEIARELGGTSGRRNMEKWLRIHGVDAGSPMLMSKFQDFQHGLRGPDHANATSEYGDDRARVCRTKCGWHTGRPEGAESYCRYFSERAIGGYGAADPALHEIRISECMSWGDERCVHEFWYTDAPAADKPPRHLWKRD